MDLFGLRMERNYFYPHAAGTNFFQKCKMNIDGTNIQQLTSDNYDNSSEGWALGSS